MYLLILEEANAERMIKEFTFHNVSINSITELNAAIIEFKFTFHNVSINSVIQMNETQEKVSFTFHNVSINSSTAGDFSRTFFYLHSIMYLLILMFIIIY